MHTYTSLVRHAGNEELFLFAELSILGLAKGWPVHVHVEGLRGTGKTTILRAARAILPPLTRIRGCPYNCDPLAPHCPLHAGLSREEIAALGTETIPAPFLEISHAAKIGTVVGTLDLKRLTDANHPEAALLPGTLPQAHRGVVFVDEINRLADTAPELTDILLDVMGTKPGRVQIEENGLPPVAVPLQVSVWATSNPDEDPGPLADIRRQLSDRFDFVVQMGRPGRPEEILAILNAGLTTSSPWRTEGQDRERTRWLTGRAARLDRLALEGGILAQLADLYLRHHLESLRAVEALKLGALLHAAWRGAGAVEACDVAAVAAAALRHRTRAEDLRAVLAYLEQPSASEGIEAAGVLAEKGRATRAAPMQSRPQAAEALRRTWKQGPRWWRSLQDRWRQLLGARGAGRGSGGGGQGGGPRGEGGGRFPNPLDLPLVAPPRPARPLTELETEEAVTVIEGKAGSTNDTE
ncbi:MAG TPA: magnesium chelatase [Firmicutes bacterium]|nr:magnesium chelatase [Bacillota bacterium]